jgi:V/A-type H+-transporting ATPase subunit A
MNQTHSTHHSKGQVIKAFGNLIHVQFEGSVIQGEIAFVELEGLSLKAEVIEIAGDIAKMQVFEDTKGIHLGSQVRFTGYLLEAELGPGLLTSIVDGLQNPLQEVADAVGLFLNRGVYMSPLNRQKRWDFIPEAKVGQVLERGDALGSCLEGRFHHTIMLPFALYDKYTLTYVAPAGAYNVETVIAKGVDRKGKEHEFKMMQRWPVKIPLHKGTKIKPVGMLKTGLRTIDTQFPIVQGGSFCSPGPFGAGKTVLQHHLSKYSSVDIVIIAACGERAGEVVEVLKTFPHLTDPHTNEPLINRTVIICNTSSMPVAAREASIYMGATIAEYYRQMGLSILLLADSTSRWAQAMREMSGRLEEIPGDEAFPAYLASRIAAFYERAGVLSLKHGKQGSLTIGGTVSPAGGNFEEPVTQATLSVVGAFLGLSRARSDARRYPAIDPLISWSKYLPQVAEELKSQVNDWGPMVKKGAYILRASDEIRKRMEVVGEDGISLEDMILHLKGELYDFCYLQQNAFDKEDCFAPLERQIPLFEMFIKIFNADYAFENHDEARSFFLDLQNSLKNMNFLPFKSEEYKRLSAQVLVKISSAERKEGALI